MTTLLLTNDLLFSSRVEGAAQRVGATLQTVSPGDSDRLDQVLDASSENNALKLVLLDLDAMGEALTSVLERLGECPSGRPAVVAYGAHVHHQRLAEARKAGCDEVLTRGQFDADTDAIFRRYVG